MRIYWLWTRRMSSKTFENSRLGGACAVALLAGVVVTVTAQQQTDFFSAADADHDGFVTREEFRAATAKWVQAGGTADEAQLTAALDTAFPESALTAMLRGRGPQNQTPKASDVEKMMAALPSAAPAKPKHPRKVLVLAKCAGFVHSCIPLAGKTVEELGKKTGAWTATVTYDPAAITAENLKQYDLLFLNNTTGAFLDDPDPAVTAARKKALLEFVRSGKGLAGIHAAADSYHEAGPGAPGLGAMLSPIVMTAAGKDKKLTAADVESYSDKLFDKLDPNKTGKVSLPDLKGRLLFAIFSSAAGRGPAMPAAGRPGRDYQAGTWPDFNNMIGGFFKWHWMDPTHIVYKIDDPDSPLTAMFRNGPFAIDDETYTFSVNGWSRKNLHVLTSIDYAQMKEADKLKEDFPREDHDYGLSWIRRAGKGRVFYEAHGHNERVYAIKPMLEHLLAGTQYALGDLKADDSPSK
jgi:type 1 glutamine amidotransferase